MKFNEKKSFGTKPGRRSKTEENEPARVYRPRTAKFTIAKFDKSNENEFETEKSDPSEKRSDYKKPTREKGYEPSTGYRRKDSSTPTRNEKGSKSGSWKDTDETKKTTRRVLKRSEQDSDSSYSRTRESRSGGKKYRNEESSKRSFEGKQSNDFSKGRFEKPKGLKRDGKKWESTKDEKFSSKEKRSGKDYSHKKFEDNDSQKPVKFSKRAPLIEADLATDSDGNIRLNKFIANSGLCSRREADEYIKNGMITVNGVTIDQLGAKVKLTDEIRFKGKDLDPEKKVYILLNKPKDYITTVEDPNAKRTVMELIKGACQQRVYPVGRLDRNSTGLLLLTNDGELTKRLTHPSYLKKKVYEVGLERPLDPSDLKSIAAGIELDDEIVKPDAIEYIDPSDLSEIGIEIHTGQNRVVRRIFEKLGYRVQKLDRVYFAGLTKKNLPRGKWRFLTPNEVTMLKMNRF